MADCSANRSETPIIVATDGELLMRFARHRDEEAFRLLMQRHSSLVYRVCQTILRERHDADDAFQATFLVLVRRSKDLESYESIAGWLYKVALRTSIAARAKRGRQEQTMMTEPIEDTGAFSAIEQQELAFSLHEELAKLPEQYRTPLVLCYLNGKSRLEIAKELDVTTQTIKARLARGRAKLRSNLTRRGIAFSISFAAGTSVFLRSDRCPAQLLSNTTELCTCQATAGAPPPSPSDSVTNLVHEGIKTMSISYLGKTATAIAVATVAITGTIAAQGNQKSGFGRTSDSRPVTLVTVDGANSAPSDVAGSVRVSQASNATRSTPILNEPRSTGSSPSRVTGLGYRSRSTASSQSQPTVSAETRNAAVDALIKALDDDAADVRHAAAKALEVAGAGSDAAIQALGEICVQHEDDDLRTMAFDALSSIGRGSDSAIDVAMRIIKNEESPAFRIRAVSMLEKIGRGKERAVAAATNALADENAGVRKHAAAILGKLVGGTKSVQPTPGFSNSSFPSTYRPTNHLGTSNLEPSGERGQRASRFRSR